MNRKILENLSPSSQKILALLARTPEDSVHFHQRLTVFHAALRIGVDVMERAVPGVEGPEKQAAALGVMYALGAATAIECCMKILEQLHPELGKINLTSPAPPAPDRVNGSRLRPMDLD